MSIAVKHAIDAMTSFHDRLNVIVWTSVKDECFRTCTSMPKRKNRTFYTLLFVPVTTKVLITSLLCTLGIVECLTFICIITLVVVSLQEA